MIVQDFQDIYIYVCVCVCVFAGVYGSLLKIGAFYVGGKLATQFNQCWKVQGNYF